MEQIRPFGDPRLALYCVYCGGDTSTKDHVPSKILLDEPYPENLPTVLACAPCNAGFSLDEEYVACLVDAVVTGSGRPHDAQRPKVSRILWNKPALSDMLERSRTEEDGATAFAVDEGRVRNVVLKLARGHAAFELDDHLDAEAARVRIFPLRGLNSESCEKFEAPPVTAVFPEVGSRAMLRMMVVSVVLAYETDPSQKVERQILVYPGWMEVQPGRYRYLAAVDGTGQVVVRIVLSEAIGCEVSWD